MPPMVKDDNIYMKLFKNIPRNDVEMVFPEHQGAASASSTSCGSASTAGGGLGIGAFGAAGKIALLATNPIVAAGAVVGLGGIAFRQAVNFMNQKQRYMVVMAQNLYFHSMADNRGVILKLADRAAEEDIKEEMLLYSVLAKERARRQDLPDIDAAIEQYLTGSFGVSVDFDFEDALDRLIADGLVTEARRRHAVDAAAARGGARTSTRSGTSSSTTCRSRSAPRASSSKAIPPCRPHERRACSRARHCQRMTTRRKLSARVTTLDMARSLAGALEDLLEPPPDALSQFEEGPGRVARRSLLCRGRTTSRPSAQRWRPPSATNCPRSSRPMSPTSTGWRYRRRRCRRCSAGRFTVHGSHDRGRIPHGPNAIMIDAGEAFGTAHHATTLGCLMAIDQLARRAHSAACSTSAADRACSPSPRRARCRGPTSSPPISIRSPSPSPPTMPGPTACSASPSPAPRAWRIPAAACRPLRPRHRQYPGRPAARACPRHRRIVRPGGIVVLSGILEPEAPAVIAAYRAQGSRSQSIAASPAGRR